MPSLIEKISAALETLALEVVTLEESDIPGLDRIKNTVCTLEGDCQEMEDASFLMLIQAVRGYLERLLQGSSQDMVPLEEGISRLQDIYQAWLRNEAYKEDISDLLGQLGMERPSDETQTNGAATQTENTNPDMEIDLLNFNAGITAEDKIILNEFVSESLENLATIEVVLIELEQKPEDREILNAIFRPFHTIKGVSGFLELDKINQLAHRAENLLDMARNKELRIEGPVVDIILETVDTLTRMIEDVREGLENDQPFDKGRDISALVVKIEEASRLDADDRGVLAGSVETTDLGPKDPAEPLAGGSDMPDSADIPEPQAFDTAETIVTEQGKPSGQALKHRDLTVKVDTFKLDELVDMTGELVIAHSMLRKNSTVLTNADQKLQQTLTQINEITSALQRTAMSMRMVPISSTFRKMIRLVRDLAKNSGKQIQLNMQGEETEIDRNVVEELYEPIVHMIRNAVDHGIEIPAERMEQGKPPGGTIELRAYHSGGNIVIEIEDDGRGLNKDRILEKARLNEFIGEDSKTTDPEIYNLIFQPGLSTAEQVTGISGRGVGMDVVKRAIEKLRGRVEIASIPGERSTFTIRLPLTLAVVDGMLVRVGQERYIIPTFAIIECFLPQKSNYYTVEGKGEMVLLRDNLIPLVRLDRIFGVQADAEEPWDGLAVTVENNGEKRCLLLDEVLGKEEVVIKNLGMWMKDTRGVAGAAIMGDGRVGLILDIPGIIEIADQL
jgi:two-component system chemotaxis sensor kinase CheA